MGRSLAWIKTTFHVPTRPSAPLEVAWAATNPYAVTGPGIETARWREGCRI